MRTLAIVRYSPGTNFEQVLGNNDLKSQSRFDFQAKGNITYIFCDPVNDSSSL